jgi:UDP-glucose-4-epimerase GalE
MNVLICGGAGYIGSHMCKRLAREGHAPITFDNLSTGHEWAVKWGPLLRGDLLDPIALANTFRDHRIEAVLHFAACSLVSESVLHPELYFRNNVTGTLNLLDAMRTAGVGRLVFSSSAAVYGDPEYTPIDEAHPTRPINPYGWSKLMAERVIEEQCQAHGMRAVSLRYFNAAGADSDGEIGEAHEPETHLIPNVIRAAIDPSCAPVKLFGNDYDTPDGTCVRDYVHVEDVCDAHLRALDLLDRVSGFQVFNLGSGLGHSVSQVIAVCREQCGGAPASIIVPRRRGDPHVLIASSSAAAAAFGWVPLRTLKDCISTAIVWHRQQP